MWVPFIALFAFAGLGLEVLEGDEIRSESSLYLGYLGTLFIGGSMAFIFNLVSFFPLTIFVNKFAKSQLYKIVLFTVSGGVIGVLALGAYDSLFMKDYQFSIILFWAAKTCRNRFGQLVCFGFMLNFFIYYFINISMVLGLMPTVGVPLPLMSFGGSSLLSLLFGFGLCQNAHINKDQQLSAKGS